jgi:hypothetical protein
MKLGIEIGKAKKKKEKRRSMPISLIIQCLLAHPI